MKRGGAMQTVQRAVSALLLLVLLSGVLTSCAKKAPALSNPNADDRTARVYAYLCSLNGKTLSGQQESTWIDGPDYEMDVIFNASGKYPAIRGLDYMNDDFDGVNERAAAWAARGGLVTVCWHTGKTFSGEWADATGDEVADWDALFTDGTAENKALLDGMDKAAAALAELQEQGVTVLWRPFHEADGGWFWWGKGGPENFKKLWVLMYERYTEHWHLNNLIWVLGFSQNGEEYADWYPGDAYCDVIGADSYLDPIESRLYKAVKKVDKGQKPLCFHECGQNPTGEQLQEVPWCWFMTWHSEYLTDNNSAETLDRLYNSANVVTLDDLPAF